MKKILPFIVLGIVIVLCVKCCDRIEIPDVIKVEKEEALPQRPNILLILTDQQSYNMLGSMHTDGLSTPNMDRLKAGGLSFARTYATNPVCVPSRFSLQTSHYPSAIKMRHNTGYDKDRHVSIVNEYSVAHLLNAAGYESVYGGKAHFPNSYDKPMFYGYTHLTAALRDELAVESVDFIKNRSEDEPPFYLVSSFINPHDICYMALREFDNNEWYKTHTPQKLLDAMVVPDSLLNDEALFDKYMPELPENYNQTEGESSGVKALMDIRPYKYKVREQWGEREWRMHRWAYYRLTEYVDRNIGLVLDALASSPFADNTIIIFTSDHGEMSASHRLEHKSVFYEESARVPFIFYGPGVAKGKENTTALVSNGLDLMPTICDMVGVVPPSGYEGKSLKPLLDGKSKDKQREYLFVENQVGYMVTDGRYKYAEYEYDGINRELFDLKNDEGELKNIAYEEEYQPLVEEMRQILLQDLARRAVVTKLQ